MISRSLSWEEKRIRVKAKGIIPIKMKSLRLFTPASLHHRLCILEYSRVEVDIAFIEQSIDIFYE